MQRCILRMCKISLRDTLTCHLKSKHIDFENTHLAIRISPQFETVRKRSLYSKTYIYISYQARATIIDHRYYYS